ncbi:MAG TPA: sigma-70 family RNA polymerase sigma factor [Acidisarcina sp.]
MEDAVAIRGVMVDQIAGQDRRISDVIETAGPKLRNFIRSRVPDREDAEDILQDVFFELTEAYRLMKPIEQVSGWLYRVARNRITDLFRRRTSDSLSDPVNGSGEEDELLLEEVLPSPDAGPEAAYARAVLIDAVEEALGELPRAQSEAFLAHEVMGMSFREMAAETGESVNTLLSRKRYAVLHLRRRLRTIYSELPKS